ncbi:MAG: pimeloyl-CoA dehydrogenase large subunit [Alphaproteobacteria bacterium]|nr:pimeloyl-CoA dehydrogenase large subunit [Alphaproteobacteria bacterium]
MQLIQDPSVEEFRKDVRDFLTATLPDDIRQRSVDAMYVGRAMQTRWHKILLAHGWGAPSWPKEHGGTGWSLAQQYVFDHELADADAPRGLPFGIDMVGPLLFAYGTEAQRKRYLPGILSGDEWWCQGFSEPGSGSDLASLQCKAKRDGDAYVLNGTKLWQTLAMDADMMFGLFRTDGSGKKQEGITVLLVDMHSPGLTLRPITLIDGSVEVAQCFFDDVRVPAGNRVGEENKGWGCAKYLLGIERLGIAEVARSKALLRRLKRLVASQTDGGAPVLADPYVARRIADIEVDLMALEATEYRFLFDPAHGGELGPEASILKLVGTQVEQRIAEAMMEAFGPYAQPAAGGPEGTNEPPVGHPFAEPATRLYFNMRKISIYGGSNEIQRNIVSKAVLGL